MISAIIIGVTCILWILMYSAQFLTYDDNYGSLLVAFLLSIGTTFLLAIVWFQWKDIRKTCQWQIILFLLVASPVTIAIVCINYECIFGTMLNN